MPVLPVVGTITAAHRLARTPEALVTPAVLRAHAARLPLPDGSVDLIVTSPPFYALRSYTDGGVHYAGQVGSEPTWQEYIENLLDCTREWIRVLKPTGNLFVELGDKYSGNETGGALTAPGPGLTNPMGMQQQAARRTRYRSGMPPKCLMDLPHRYAIRCVDDLGLIKRAEIPWHHVNGLPESVTDRVRRAHSMVFHFTRQPRYYAAVDEIREPHDDRNKPNGPRGRDGLSHAQYVPPEKDGLARRGFVRHTRPEEGYNPLGKLPGSVWSIPSQPLIVPPELGIDHFAAFPMELPRRVILGWSPPGVCTACGQGRRPIVDKRYLSTPNGYSSAGRWGLKGQPQDTPLPVRLGDGTSATITGYACACGEDVMPDGAMARQFDPGSARHVTRPPSGGLPPARPAVVLDPFGGTGTTALVASVLGRHGITADLSADYCRLAAWRTTDPGERARAMQVPKPPPVPDGQEALFTMEGT